MKRTLLKLKNVVYINITGHRILFWSIVPTFLMPRFSLKTLADSVASQLINQILVQNKLLKIYIVLVLFKNQLFECDSLIDFGLFY